MSGSASNGTGRNGRQLRKELEVRLACRLNGLYANGGSYAEKRSVVDALEDLMGRKSTKHVVAYLEMCGVLDAGEAGHFLGPGAERNAIEEATGLLFRSILRYAIKAWRMAGLAHGRLLGRVCSTPLQPQHTVQRLAIKHPYGAPAQMPSFSYALIRYGERHMINAEEARVL